MVAAPQRDERATEDLGLLLSSQFTMLTACVDLLSEKTYLLPYVQ